MSPIIHSLAEEYPEYHDLMPGLCSINPHFAALIEEYQGVDHRIQQVESLKERASDTELAQLKRHRLALKDEILFLLEQAARA